MIQSIGLSKSYKTGNRERVALAGVSMNVETGGLAALVGPNGAGKTTLVKTLATLIIPDSGTAYVNGYSLKEESEIRRSIGLVTLNERTFYFGLTGLENLVFWGAIHSMSLHDARVRARELLQMVGLGDWQDVRAGKYSTGMRARLVLARSLIHDPPVLLLDEPTLGVDVIFSKYIKELIRSLSGKKTILITSHSMKDIEELDPMLFVLNHGRIVGRGHVSELRENYGVSVELRMPRSNMQPRFAKNVVYSTGSEVVLHLPQRKMGGMAGFTFVKEVVPSLEDIYVELVAGEEELRKGV